MHLSNICIQDKYKFLHFVLLNHINVSQSIGYSSESCACLQHHHDNTGDKSNKIFDQ